MTQSKAVRRMSYIYAKKTFFMQGDEFWPQDCTLVQSRQTSGICRVMSEDLPSPETLSSLIGGSQGKNVHIVITDNQILLVRYIP